MKSHRSWLMALFFVVATIPGHSADKTTFWNVQQKGANCFNKQPTEEWFRAAHTLGITWVRLAFDKWDGAGRDFLMGDADNFQGVIQSDLRTLVTVLDWAHQSNIKVVIAPLGLPGCRWVQNNNNVRDLRLWHDKSWGLRDKSWGLRDKSYWLQAAEFWRELADSLKDHPAVVGYNILNEPVPEKETGLAEHGPAAQFFDWYKKYQNTTHDLVAFYEFVIHSIRAVDAHTPIMLDAGWYAQPNAFVYWPKFENNVLYAFHLYEPFEFTNHRNYKEKKNLAYPGEIPFAGQLVHWDRTQINNYLAPFFQWAEKQGIPANRIVAGEFGCFRKNKGAQDYLTDVIAIFNQHDIHWAFYAFREDEWDGYDYELGTGGLGWQYWQDKEAGKNPALPRKDNPLFDVMKREFR